MSKYLSLVAVFLVTLMLGTGIARAQDEDYNVSLSDGSALPGQAARVSLTMDFADGEEIVGWQWGVCHDDDVLTLEEGDVWDGATAEELDFTFTNITIVSEVGAAGWFGGYLLDVITYEVLEPGDGYEIAEMDYHVSDDAEPGFTDVTWCETLGSPLVATRVIVGGMEIIPTQWDGTVEILEEISFLRGDANNDGVVSPLIDALMILDFGFNDGAQPVCMDAADIDDNGVVSLLLDALALLQFGFDQGDAPAAPGPEVCGLDVEVDDLECNEATCP